MPDSGATSELPILIEFPRAIRVLVVEDDFGDFDAVARAMRKLEAFEAKVVRAKTVEAARRAVADQAFDVYLIDYNLGMESGLRFLQDIMRQPKHGVPILLTGLLDRRVHEISLRAGVVSCINKSDLTPTLLETTLRTALYNHRLQARLSDLVVAAAQSTDQRSTVAGLRALAQEMPWLNLRSTKAFENAD